MTDLMEQPYGASRAAQEEPPVARAPGPLSAQADEPPDWDNWEKKPKGSGFIARLFVTPPRWALWIVRALPVPQFFVRFVGRYDEVIDVLSRPDIFRVPAAKEIARLNGGKSRGTPYILGIDKPKAHDAHLSLVMCAFPRGEIATRVVLLAAQSAKNCVPTAAEQTKFDAVQGLFIEVALDICEQYFGVPLGPDRLKFAYATFTISGHLFKKPPIEGKAADEAAAYLRYFIEQALHNEARKPINERTVVANMVAHAKAGKSSLEQDGRDFNQIRAILMSMIVAFVTSNTMAAAHILEVLLDKPQALEEAVRSTGTGDDARLECVLFEALRFRPINAGPFRICTQDYVLAEGTPREKRIRKGSIVWAMSFAAMFDPLRIVEPGKFDWTRPKSDHLHFGSGMHACVGLLIARAHLTQCFKALLTKRRAIRRAGRTRYRGAMPIELEISKAEPPVAKKGSAS